MGNAVNRDSQKAIDRTDEPAESPREIRSCPICGANFSATKENELCPVCLLRDALIGGAESTKSPSEDVTSATAKHASRRFEHYEVALGEDGRPLELGRGAMGVTYKAIDVDLQCPVTLKVISEKYLGDEAARSRFLREARAAASVRHPNVASVFHLGRRGRDYFYAMEFVEGETLYQLIKRSGSLEIKLALEITRQVAAGLAAVHKKSLVHRDIKPNNIMVSFEEEGAVTAKIIDLGLAKVDDESSAQTTISASGAFAGTPEFASPEQIIGGEVDIRSDLYSLGVSLWQMLVGAVPFRGSAAVVMAQHQHAEAPLERLQGVPQPVVSVIDVLLSKDPGRRFQTPGELLKALPTTIGVIEEGKTIIYDGGGLVHAQDFSSAAGKPPARQGPENISIARLPVTGSDLFGREEDIAFLNEAWANPDVNIVTIVAWAGVGKSTLVNHWLRGMAAEHYRAAELVFGWSFYRQGSSAGTASADEFLDAALSWFGDPNPRMGTAWEKGERLAKLISHRRTLLVLDGLEPLQNPPGSQEGRLRDPSLQALLKELAAFNTGLCVITTRLQVADIADHERASAPRRDLERLSNEAGAKLLRALGVKGDQAELRSASDDFGGHCLALTLLGSYLTDAYDGDIRCRREVSEHLSHDVRQGARARRVMESYQTWFGEGPELSVLRILGLFDRPANEKALEALLKPPSIPGLTESLTDLSLTEWRTILTRLRRARLLAGEDPHSRGDLDTHPLIREHFGEQLQSQRTEAWKECNRRLFDYYRTLAPELPESFREMEPLFLAVICGCHAGLFREALHEVYFPRIQRGSASFASKVLGAREALLSVLIHFFEHGRWGLLVDTGDEGERLTAEDQLFVLMEAAQYLTATRGMGAPEMCLCYERAEFLCRSLDRPMLLYVALLGQWRYCVTTDTLTRAMKLAERVYSLTQQQNDPALVIGGYMPMAITHYFLGEFEKGRQYTKRGLQILRSGVESALEEVDVHAVGTLYFEAVFEWHAGEIVSCHATMTEAISLAKELNDTHGLAAALWHAGWLGYFERNPSEVERCASDLIELSIRQSFAYWLAGGKVLRGWARSASGDTAEGILWIEEGIREYQAMRAIRGVTDCLVLKAEALHFADRTFEALEAIRLAEELVERSGARWFYAEVHRLRGVFLTAIEGEAREIEVSFCEAMRIAKEQHSISLQKRAESTYAEYCRQKASAAPGHGLRLPLN
jgi:Protein kinase domain/NACHT domain